MSISTLFPRVRFDFSAMSLAHRWKINALGSLRRFLMCVIAWRERERDSEAELPSVLAGFACGGAVCS